MLEDLKREVLAANKMLPEHKLVTFTWGNVSGIDRQKGLVIIKPSGVPYETMMSDDMVVLDLDGNIIEGRLNPSSDAPTHLEIYKAFGNVGGVVHTHSNWATCWAQSCRDIPAYGTTHADFFYGSVPCTRPLTKLEVETAYEKETGRVIVETFNNRDIDPEAVTGVIVNKHGPFSWGKNAAEAVHNAVVLEAISNMAYHTELINHGCTPIENYLLKKHYMRKNGPDAYYGQERG
ncbi:MAG: L-ribulose-5-phosphate 4-epimerase [Clostridia bacterium]|nr:L-ribulose-5-phosphate 4-epimerase [Clostridia bacterium]